MAEARRLRGKPPIKQAVDGRAGKGRGRENKRRRWAEGSDWVGGRGPGGSQGGRGGWWQTARGRPPNGRGVVGGSTAAARRRTGALATPASARRLASSRRDQVASLPRLGGRRRPLAIKELGVTRLAPGPWPWSRLSQHHDHWGRACAAARLPALATGGDQPPPKLLSVPSPLAVNPTNPSWSTPCAVSGCCDSGMVRWIGGGGDDHHHQCSRCK